MRILLLALVLLAAQPLHAACIGDCDGDGDVAVAELIGLLRCMLNPFPVELPCTACPAADALPRSINYLIAAVNNALQGCPARTCRADVDCLASGGACIPPGGSPGCGICRDDPDECSLDDHCPRDFVCAPAPAPPCPCDGTPARICVRRCPGDDACGKRQRCLGGRCVRDACAADADCADAGTCVVGACHDAPGTCQLPPP